MRDERRNLFESIIDWTRSSLDPDIVGQTENGDYYVLPEVEVAIKDAIAQFYDIDELDEFFIKGSSLTYEWLPHKDIDIYMVDSSLSDEKLDQVRQDIVRPFNKKYIKLLDTDHPLEIYIDNAIFDTDKADVMWDLIKSEWIKEPRSVHANLPDYWDKFKETVDVYDNLSAELYRDVIDLELLQGLLEDAYPEEKEQIRAELSEKLDEIEASLDEAGEEFQDILDLRHASFNKDVAEEYKEMLKELQSRNLLPDNVIFKLAQRYFYLAFLKMLRDLGDSEENTSSKIDDVKDVFKAKSRYLDKIGESLDIILEYIFIPYSKAEKLLLHLESEYSDFNITDINKKDEVILLESKQYDTTTVERAYELYNDIHSKYPSVVINVRFPEDKGERK